MGGLQFAFARFGNHGRSGFGLGNSTGGGDRK